MNSATYSLSGRLHADVVSNQIIKQEGRLTGFVPRSSWAAAVWKSKIHPPLQTNQNWSNAGEREAGEQMKDDSWDNPSLQHICIFHQIGRMGRW